MFAPLGSRIALNSLRHRREEASHDRVSQKARVIGLQGKVLVRIEPASRCPFQFYGLDIFIGSATMPVTRWAGARPRVVVYLRCLPRPRVSPRLRDRLPFLLRVRVAPFPCAHVCVFETRRRGTDAGSLPARAKACASASKIARWPIADVCGIASNSSPIETAIQHRVLNTDAPLSLAVLVFRPVPPMVLLLARGGIN